MKRNLKRLGIALVISMVCFWGTVLWYKSGLKTHSNNSSQQPLARLTEVYEDVQRREPKRVMWEPLKAQDELFPGDSIRTNGNASAKITLLKSGASVYLEPDSLVVLEETGQGLTIDFLQGHIFLQKAGATEELTLKTDSGLIKLKETDLNLSRKGQGPTELEVLKGQADYQVSGKTFSLVKDKSAQLSAQGLTNARSLLKMLAPTPGQTQYVAAGHKENLKVQWQPLADKSEVTVELGPTRSTLTAIGTFKGDSGAATLMVKPGKWFMRLISKSPNANKPPAVSPAVPLVVERAQAPTLLEPKSDTPVLRSDAQAPIEFRWTNRNNYKHQLFELAKDVDFKQVVKRQEFDGQINTLKTPVPDGRYHWRVTGSLPPEAGVVPLASPRQTIDVLSHWEVKPAQLLKPENEKEIALREAQKGIELKWQGSPGIHHFMVNVEKQSAAHSWQYILESQTQAQSLILTNVTTGDYRWKVTSFAGADTTSGLISDHSTFQVGGIARLEWASNLGLSYEYSTPKPSLRASWMTIPEALSYRYRFAPEGIDFNSTPWLETKQNVFEVPVARDGRYVLALEALGANQRVVARADNKVIEVHHRPELAAPKWAGQTPEVLRPDSQGQLSLAWLPVNGAKRYILLVEDSGGSVVHKRSTELNSARLSQLKVGNYQVKIKSVDALERTSAESLPKILEVPATTDLQAPRIKRVKVK